MMLIDTFWVPMPDLLALIPLVLSLKYFSNWEILNHILSAQPNAHLA